MIRANDLATTFAALLMLVASFGASAQGTSAERQLAPGVIERTDASSTRTIYSQEFFAAYRAINAKDMLEHVPGIVGLTSAAAQNANDDRRGLRSNTDQVLINGKRVTGKEGGSAGYLEKIPASRILQIEVIIGDVKELDADVGARVINLVTDETAKSSGSFQAGIVEFATGNTRPNLQINYGGEAGALSYTLALETRPRMLPSKLQDDIASLTAAIGRTTELRDREQRNYNGRALLAYDFGAGRNFQVNVFADHLSREDFDTFRTFSSSPAGAVPTSAVLDHTTGRDTVYEISSDYVHPFGSGLKFLGLFVVKDKTTIRRSDINNVLGPIPVQTGGDSREERGSEKILRGTLQIPIRSFDQAEVGVEVARNSLDKNLDFYALTNGRRIDIQLFNSDQVASEDRIEMFSSYSWKATDFLQFEPGLAAEFSWLDQVGSDVNEKRQFQFAKPSLNILYNLSATSQIYFNVVRDVGQLSFEDFAATVDREADEIIGGNPFLVPEKAWELTLGVDERFASGVGSLNVKSFYKQLEDVNDRVPLAAGLSGPGNIGKGRVWGGRVEGSIKFSKLDLPDITMNGSILWQQSSVKDPFTGLKRRIGNLPKYEIAAVGRHDLQASGTSYGFEYNKNGPTLDSDVAKFDQFTTGGDWRLFVEQNISNGLILRLFVGNALSATNTRERTLYLRSQADGRILQRQFRRERPTYFYGFRLRGNF